MRRYLLFIFLSLVAPTTSTLGARVVSKKTPAKNSLDDVPVEININGTLYIILGKYLRNATLTGTGDQLELKIPKGTPLTSNGKPVTAKEDRTATTSNKSNGTVVKKLAKPIAPKKTTLAKPISARLPASVPSNSKAAPTAPTKTPTKTRKSQSLGADKAKPKAQSPAPTPVETPLPAPEPAPAPIETTDTPTVLGDDDKEPLLAPNLPPLPTEADLAKVRAENDAALAKEGLPPDMEVHPYSQLMRDKFKMRSNYLIDAKTGKPTLDSKGQPQVFWTPNIDYEGEDTVIYSIYSPHESRRVKKSATVPFHNVSELTSDYKGENGEVLIKKGEKVYEVELDENTVYFARADDPSGSVFEAPRSQFITPGFQRPLRKDLEDYRATSEAFKKATETEGGMAEDSEGARDNSGSTQEEAPTDPHSKDAKPSAATKGASTKNLRGPSKQNYARDCNPKSGTVTRGKKKINYDTLYAEKESFSLKSRRKYRQSILDAANKYSIHPAIIESSIHLETDFNPAKENDTEKKSMGYDKDDPASLARAEARVNTPGKRKSFWGKGLGQIGPAECASMGIVWAGSYEEYLKAGRKPENSIWNPVTAINGKARLMRMKLDEAKLQAARRNINSEEAINHMINRDGNEGVAEQARYIISMFNRGMMSVNSLAYFVNHDSEKSYPKYYGQVWSSGPAKRNYDVYLNGHEINRAHIYRAAGLCGGVRPNSLLDRYMKEYKESVDSDGKTKWSSAV